MPAAARPPTGHRLLVANRGEVAVRIVRAAADLGIATVGVASTDDAEAPHTAAVDEVVSLAGVGPAAYLDIDAVVAAAAATGCTLVHPGTGLLSEDHRFAAACSAAGLTFVGPPPEVLAVLGDKVAARSLAQRCGVPVLEATGPVDAGGAADFVGSLGAGAAAVIKAVAGGGGRGMRVVRDVAEVAAAHERAASEAAAAFGSGRLYVERYLPGAHHVEVQVVADAAGAVTHLGERECSLQRRHQKLVEVAPSPSIDDAVRTRLTGASVAMASEVGYRGVGTFEFLVAGEVVAFIEANPRLQVEHTVTEEVTGVDLVVAQIRLALGATLADLGLGGDPPPPRGLALQVRVNAETVRPDGSLQPGGGRFDRVELPAGPGIRVDTAAVTGSRTNPRFDPLVAKVVAHAPDGSLATACTRAERALRELRLDGVATNATFLRALLARSDVRDGSATTETVQHHIAELAETAAAIASAAVPDAGHAVPSGVAHEAPSDPAAPPDLTAGHDPTRAAAPVAPPGSVVVVAPLPGTVAVVAASVGDAVPAGREIVVLEAMKMEHLVAPREGGVVRTIVVAPGDVVDAGDVLAVLDPADVERDLTTAAREVDLDDLRPDLAAVVERHALGLDAARPEAVERRRRTGQRTARENVDDLCDPGSFVEVAPLVIAAQRRRRDVDDLIRRTPADGLVAGFGRVNGDRFDDAAAQCVVLSYDYTVLAGTQGFLNHRKKDRLFELAERWRTPVVFFTEGGGGRPGDTDAPGVAGLDTMAFHLFGRLSGQVPLVGIASGRCFAGNAALLGCCDVVIATEGSSIGMGGPAMIEGGGLGVVHPDEVGPLATQVANGVVDVAVADEAEAVAVAKGYLSYFQGPVAAWEVADQRRLRHAIPENRKRTYDVRAVIGTMFDVDSVLELRRGFGAGMVTALARVEGRPVGVVANDPTHLAGAIDSEGADKAARFLQLCDAFGLPVVSLCDTPGIMVGIDAERSGTVRHASRLFVTGASLSVPVVTIVLRKAYGLGAQAMAAGSFHATTFTVSWPTGEFGGMGLEGAVKLGFRKELEAIDDPDERAAAFEMMVVKAYEHGSALNTASHFEIDDVIDPAESRRWISSAITAGETRARRGPPRRPFVDTW